MAQDAISLERFQREARARVPLADRYAESGRADDAVRELNLAMAMRSNAGMVLYNAAGSLSATRTGHQAPTEH